MDWVLSSWLQPSPIQPSLDPCRHLGVNQRTGALLSIISVCLSPEKKNWGEFILPAFSSCRDQRGDSTTILANEWLSLKYSTHVVSPYFILVTLSSWSIWLVQIQAGEEGQKKGCCGLATLMCPPKVHVWKFNPPSGEIKVEI